MMFPSAVQGHMPFADKYREEQIKRVIQKQRSRHHSGPDQFTSNNPAKAALQKNTSSMPILWQSVYTGQKPKFISMPTLEHRQPRESPKSSKNGILQSLRSIFKGKKDTVDSAPVKSLKKVKSEGAIVENGHSRFYTVQIAVKKPAETDLPPLGRSPKRQRMRTISNISTVMETIEEINENLVSIETLSDSSCSDSTSINSNAELSRGSLFYQSRGSSRESSHHSSAEILCSA